MPQWTSCRETWGTVLRTARNGVGEGGASNREDPTRPRIAKHFEGHRLTGSLVL